MTAIWGPLGWMTLHSVALSYSEVPTESEKILMSKWLDLFRDTITCNHCREHFTSMLARYKTHFPTFLNSRQSFVVATFRMHNTVNRRLSKPIYNTVAECISTLEETFKRRTPTEYRIAYLTHITNYWKTMQDITGIVSLRKIQEMRKIEVEYFTPKSATMSFLVAEEQVVLPSGILEKDTKPVLSQSSPMSFSAARAGFRITSGGLRLRR